MMVGRSAVVMAATSVGWSAAKMAERLADVKAEMMVVLSAGNLV